MTTTGAVTRGPGGPVSVAVRCSFAGAISARCLETSSIDRVVYNYVNNAVRFAAGGAVTLWVFPVAAGLTRWVVQNAIAPDQASFLAERVGDLGRLFAGGITAAARGAGWRIAPRSSSTVSGCRRRPRPYRGDTSGR